MMKDRMIQNGIEYERRGEQYYPLLDLGEQTNYEIGKYGKMHLEFIKQHRREKEFHRQKLLQQLLVQGFLVFLH